MAYNQHRVNIRNFLVGLTPNECREVLRQARDDVGDNEGAGYIAEYLAELAKEGVW